MDFIEFKQRVGMGEEFQFYCNNESYWISKNQDGYYLTWVSDIFSQSFKSSNE